jgi:tRNA A-37 threonylcarbamoyl transferase component Bud32
MAEEGGRSRTVPEQDDSFEALLKQAAHVSGPSTSSPASQLGVGSTLLGGRLRVRRCIGEGGMGVVYEAHDERRRGAVALKTLSRLDAGNVYRLKNEFRSLADVSHPSLVRLHELFGEGEQWFFTMELIDGERFDRWVRRHDNACEGPGHEGQLDEARLRAALPQLVAAIAAIHAAGKLHRDLKPSNVLVTVDGRVVVLDFGLAVDPELGGVGQTVLDDSVSGTPAYMAPEQAAGAPATAASDFYALGVMLFEALTGKLPFEGRAHDMLVDKQRLPAPVAAQWCPDVPHDLGTLCEELLRRDPSTRPDASLLRAKLGVPDESARLTGTSARQSGVAPARSSVMPERELLLGRDAELAELRAAYAATLAGQPVVLFVSGESGIGKSALVAHFLDELRAQGEATVLAGRCYERESVPFKGIDSVVDDLSRFLRKLPATEASALMPREAYALARIFPVLGRIDAVAQAPKKDIVDPQELRQRAFAAFGELLARMRDRRPLALYIDDAQWLDRDAVTFLGYLLGHYEPAAVLLVLSHRSEGAADNALLAKLYQHVHDNARLQQRQLSLGALAPDAAQALAARLLGADGADGAARAAVVAAESSGSPFFVGELSRQAQGSSSGARVTLHEALVAHIQSLPSAARHLLEMLAIAGRPLAVALALDASGASHQHIDLLHSQRLLRRTGGADEHSLECYHDKIRESVAEALSTERTRAVHASLLAVLVEQRDADAEHLALHAQGAGDREAAARYAQQAPRPRVSRACKPVTGRAAPRARHSVYCLPRAHRGRRAEWRGTCESPHAAGTRFRIA